MNAARLRRLTAAGLLAVSAAAVARGPTAVRVEERIRVRAGKFRGTLGLAAIDLDGGETISFNGDVRFPTASLIKVAVMVETYHQIAQGKLKRDAVRALADSDKVGDEPVVLNQLHAGLPLTVADLLSLMIAFSDNTATNMLLRLVGTAAVDRRMESLGLPNTRIFRPTFRDGRADVFPDLEKEFGLGMTTPHEAARLFELIARGKIVGRAACDEMLAILEKQHDRQMIPRSLPFDRERITVANKTGWDTEKIPDPRGFRGQIRTDAAYVQGPKTRYVIAILTRRGRDKRPGADNEALVTGAALSRMVYDEFNAGAARSPSKAR